SRLREIFRSYAEAIREAYLKALAEGAADPTLLSSYMDVRLGEFRAHRSLFRNLQTVLDDPEFRRSIEPKAPTALETAERQHIGRPPDTARNRAIFEVVSKMPHWESAPDELAEALDSPKANIKPPGKH